MKITSIDVYDFGKCLNYEDCSPICIRINTDAGISGFGEVGLAYGNAHNAVSYTHLTLPTSGMV